MCHTDAPYIPGESLQIFGFKNKQSPTWKRLDTTLKFFTEIVGRDKDLESLNFVDVLGKMVDDVKDVNPL